MKIRENFPKSRGSLWLLALLTLALPLSANTVRIFTLSADEWARPRNGEVIPQMAAIRSAVNYWGRGVDTVVVIRYPGEDSGELWAAELRDWLISLGVPSDYIRLVAGVQQADEIKLVVGNRTELEQ